jgi:hypothetical protein
MGTSSFPARGARVHLPVAPSSAHNPPWDRARALVLALVGGGGALFITAFFQQWWSFWLYAPQYPGGLHLAISLTGMGGDVHEIDLLNHYIGMKHLADAAPLERQLAVYGIAGIVVLTLGLFVVSGRSLNKLVAVPAIAFPLAFLGDAFYWLYSFGHALDPRAPLKIGGFTPQLFGNGKIGQFETYAQPALGFWLALAGVACVVAAAFIRVRVCRHCVSADGCTARCARFFVLPPREGKQEA